MRNDYVILGNVTVIFLRRRNGEVIGTLIDTKDLQLLLGIDCKWYAKTTRDEGVYYAYSGGVNGTQNKIYLHRLLTNAPEGLVVDHVNRRTLDNRQTNLQVVTNRENVIRGKRPERSLYEQGGVYWHKRDQRWIPRINIGGKRRWIGSFKCKSEAEKALLLYIQKIAE